MAENRDAMLYSPLDGERVRCELCAQECIIAEGRYGLCRVRRNVEGQLKTLNYDAVVAANVDPIEKKPLFHFLPGTTSLSVAAAGCNFQCAFCQNWQISQAPRTGESLSGRRISPEALVALARENGCASMSFTYTEPTVFFELAYDTARLAHEQKLANCFVSNGYLTPRAIETIGPWLDAINVDLKAFRDETYRTVMKARLEPVLTCLRELVGHGVWTEVTTLVVPDMNDSPQELADIAGFIATELGPHVPWHVTRFHGDYEMTSRPTTPVSTLELACELGRAAGLKYVYSGNVAGLADERTYCPHCQHVVIDRSGFQIQAIHLDAGRCPQCHEPIDGVWVAPTAP